jgi:hypothetical protein
MKRSLLLLICICSICFGNLRAQAIREITLPFDEGQSARFEKDVQWVIDSTYFSLRPLEKIRLILYSRQERASLPMDQLFSIASRRHTLVSKYLGVRRTASPSKVRELIDFDTTATFNTKSVADRSQLDLNRPYGIPSVLLTNSEPFYRYYPHLQNEALTRPQQEFYVVCNEEQILYTAGGLTIRIPSNSFVTEKGNAPSCCDINFIVEEYLTTKDMLLADLVTHSSGQMIETGGMVYLEAYCGTEKLKLKPGTSLYIHFPAMEKKEGMLTFNGRRTDNMSDWTIQNNGKVYMAPEETEKLFPRVVAIEMEGERMFDSASATERYYEGSEMADGYLLKTANLGWINCDRFYNIEEKTELSVKPDTEKEFCFRLVFKNIRSILPAFAVIPGLLFKFTGLPKGEKAILLGYWISNDRKTASFAWKEITIGETAEETMEMKTVSGGELAGMLSDLFPA